MKSRMRRRIIGAGEEKMRKEEKLGQKQYKKEEHNIQKE